MIISELQNLISHLIRWTACSTSTFLQQKSWIFWQHLFYICCTNLTRRNTINDWKHDLKENNQNSTFFENTVNAYGQATFLLAIDAYNIYTTSVKHYHEHETFSHKLYPVADIKLQDDRRINGKQILRISGEYGGWLTAPGDEWAAAADGRKGREFVGGGAAKVHGGRWQCREGSAGGGAGWTGKKNVAGARIWLTIIVEWKDDVR